MKLRLFPFLLIPTALSAQDFTVDLDVQRKISEEKSHGFCQTRWVKNSTVALNDSVYHLQLPEELREKPLAYMNIYYTGNPGVVPQTRVVVIKNPKDGNRVFYIDVNGNLDLSDDGPPVGWEADVTLMICPENRPAECFGELLLPFDSTNPGTYNFALKYLMPENNRELDHPFLPMTYWYFSKRINNLITETVLGGYPVKIGLHDANCNGRMNDTADLLMFQADTSKLLTHDRKNATACKPGSKFPLGDQWYEFISAESNGSRLVIRPCETPENPPLFEGQPLPNISLKSLEGKDVNLRALVKGDPVLLDIWGIWCAGCVESIPYLKKFREALPGVRIIGLNFGDDAKRIREFAEREKLDWEQFSITSESAESLRISGYPAYYFVTPDGRVLSMQANIYKPEADFWNPFRPKVDTSGN